MSTDPSCSSLLIITSISRLLIEPALYIDAFTGVLRELVRQLLTEKGQVDETTDFGLFKMFIALSGSFGAARHVSPRGLTSVSIRSLVSVEGIVTKCKHLR